MRPTCLKIDIRDLNLNHHYTTSEKKHMMAKVELLKAEMVCLSSKSGKGPRETKGNASFGKHYQNP